MCRMIAIHNSQPVGLARWLVDAPQSLAAQSRRDAAGDDHRDGWGIAWYDDTGSHVVRSTAPACDDPRFAAAAAAVSTRIALAHVRDASVGSVREENCHPFAYGSWMFCHNGTIKAFDRLKASFDRETLPELKAARRGDTDSEHLFYWLLSGAAREGFAIGPADPAIGLERIDCNGLYEVVRKSLRRLLGWSAAADLEAPQGLNLLLTDGRLLIAVRHGRSLWMQTTTDAAPATIITSEPTDASSPWRELEERSILTIDAAGRSIIRPLERLSECLAEERPFRGET